MGGRHGRGSEAEPALGHSNVMTPPDASPHTSPDVSSEINEPVPYSRTALKLQVRKACSCLLHLIQEHLGQKKAGAAKISPIIHEEAVSPFLMHWTQKMAI